MPFSNCIFNRSQFGLRVSTIAIFFVLLIRNIFRLFDTDYMTDMVLMTLLLFKIYYYLVND